MAARIAVGNLLTASGVTITSSSEAVGYVDDSLANPARWKKWRSATTTGDQWVKFDLGANKSFQLLAAIGAVLHSGGTLKAQANASDSWAPPTVDHLLTVPASDLTGVLADWISTVQSLRWIRFYFTNSGAVNSYVELGAVFAGTYVQQAQSVSVDGLSMRRIDPSVQRYAIGGQRSAVVRSKYHQISGNFPVQSKTARDDLRTVFETAGTSLPGIFALDPGTPSLNFYGHLQPVLEATHRPSKLDAAGLWDMPIEFTEDVA